MKIFLWIAQYNKAFAAFTVAIIAFINTKYGIEIPLDDETVSILWATIGGLTTWLIPNVPDPDVVKVEMQVVEEIKELKADKAELKQALKKEKERED